MIQNISFSKLKKTVVKNYDLFKLYKQKFQPFKDYMNKKSTSNTSS